MIEVADYTEVNFELQMIADQILAELIDDIALQLEIEYNNHLVTLYEGGNDCDGTFRWEH